MSPDTSWLGHQIIRIIAISDLNVFNFEKLRAVGIAAFPISTKKLHRVGCPVCSTHAEGVWILVQVCLFPASIDTSRGICSV